MKTDPKHLVNEPTKSSYRLCQDKADVEVFYSNIGLTKREYFAALAMNSLISERFSSEYIHTKSKEWARYAVIYADALIEALNKE